MLKAISLADKSHTSWTMIKQYPLFDFLERTAFFQWWNVGITTSNFRPNLSIRIKQPQPLDAREGESGMPGHGYEDEGACSCKAEAPLDEGEDEGAAALDGD
jgi:hypothetical protein